MEVMNTTPVWIRIPRSGETCPLTGLTRSTMLSLVLPCAANRFAPPVVSQLLLSNPTARRGVRLVAYDDLCRHIRSQPAHRRSAVTSSAA